MPIYEYVCEACGKVSEFLVGVGQGDKKIACRHCGSPHLKRQLSASNVSQGERINSQGGKTCCGREERCDSPPCSTSGGCRR